MFRRMKLVAALALVAMVLPAAAQAQTGFGVRGASLELSGDNVAMDTEIAYGAHVSVGFIPILKFQLGVEYLSGTATYSYGALDYTDDFTNIGVYADVRYPISLIPMFPLKPVVGGGLDLNLMSYLDEDSALGSSDPADYSRMGWHLMGGLMFDPPVVPFTVTAEYRTQSVSVADGDITIKGILVGLTFGF